ncbi:hypothetical protein KC19_10G014300 [Ceratodon purpureus]|uniref:protein-serine/threonine phosphatase n=1 Tax=Ceratodon purpureus TaxID=3225 RepID=A0A8T0GG21_CERPU|nr:hypothetical protein KC19_10G014300 [Ceratodon purpureus]
MGARISTERCAAEDSSPTDEGSGTSSKYTPMYDEVVEIRKEGDATEELSVHFGYQCQSGHGIQRMRSISTDTISETSSVDDAISVTLPSNPLTRRNSSFSSLSGAALGANATLANSSIFNGKLGEQILPGLDSPKTFRKMDPIYRTSSLNSSLSSLTQTLSQSIGSQSVPSELSALTSYADSRSSFLNARDVQMAGGAAGEDRVQAVCSEDNGWLFCGIYDGFNGRDAADFLAGTLYENIGLNLRLLEYKAQKRQALVDADDSANSGEDDAMAESDSSDMDTAMEEISDNEGVDLPQFRNGVLEGLRQAFIQTENDFLEKVEQEMEQRPDLVMVGSCVLVVLMYGRNLYTLNVGDSRAVLATSKPPKNGSKKRKSSGLYAVELTERHVIEDARERERIIGEHPEDPRAISNGRLKGKLRVTRAFGAGYLKKAAMNNALMGILRVRDLSSPPYLDVTPSVNRLQVQPEDKFVVIGSDGLYDFFSNEEVVEHINRFLLQQPTGDPAQYMVEQLLLRAAANAGITVEQLKSIPIGRRRKFHDDVTIIVVDLRTSVSAAKASTFS